MADNANEILIKGHYTSLYSVCKYNKYACAVRSADFFFRSLDASHAIMAREVIAVFLNMCTLNGVCQMIRPCPRVDKLTSSRTLLNETDAL